MKKVLVSIWCITYNHEQYIREALDSFLMQKANFNYEIVVHDDASADRTPEIIREYEKKNPGLVYGIYQTENQTSKHGADRKWIWYIQAEHCNGKYIAFCEGDDYWLDIHKLQIQIDYMEHHPECVLTAHDAVLVNLAKGEAKAMHPYEDDSDISADEIIMQRHWILPTASMIFRKEALGEDFYKYFLGAGLGDFPLQLWMMTRGKIHYFSRIMSVYRYMHQDSWSKRITGDFKNTAIHTIQMIHFLRKFDKYTEKKYQNSVARRIEIFQKSVLLIYRQHFSLEMFEKVCEQYDMETNGVYHEEYEDVKKYFFTKFHTKSCDLLGDIRQFCLKYQHIYIMGAGDFGAVIAKQMKYNGLDFEGFVISGSVEKGKTYLGKPVWGLKEIPHTQDESGIVIGINLKLWPGVIENLKEAGIKNYLISLMLKGIIEMEAL